MCIITSSCWPVWFAVMGVAKQVYDLYPYGRLQVDTTSALATDEVAGHCKSCVAIPVQPKWIYSEYPEGFLFQAQDCTYIFTGLLVSSWLMF